MTDAQKLKIRNLRAEGFGYKKIATMHYANVLLKKGIITKEQYTKINTIFANKYGTSLSTLCPQIHLK